MAQLKILHMADVHLGGSGPAFGARVGEHQRRIEAAFVRCMDLALSQQVVAVCIVGDLFDSPRPSERTIQVALRELARLAGASPPIPCFLMPGNHDCLDKACVYHRPELQMEGLRVFRKAEPESFRLEDGSLAVHGNPQPCGVTRHEPMKGLHPDPSARVNIALAHGGILLPGITEEETALLTRDEIAGCGMDYVALGHWHDPTDYTCEGVVARFCGSPEIVSIGQKQAGGALLVSLGPAGVSTSREPTGALRYDSVTLDPEVHPGEEAIEEAVSALTDDNLMLDVTISGFAPEGFTCDMARLQEHLESGFFRLRLRDDTVPPAEELASGGATRRMIAPKAVGILRERMELARQAGDADAERIARRALQLTVALFEGREVLQ